VQGEGILILTYRNEHDRSGLRGARASPPRQRLRPPSTPPGMVRPLGRAQLW